MPLCVALFGDGGSCMSFLKLRTAGNMHSQRKPARSSLLFHSGGRRLPGRALGPIAGFSSLLALAVSCVSGLRCLEVLHGNMCNVP